MPFPSGPFHMLSNAVQLNGLELAARPFVDLCPVNIIANLFKLVLLLFSFCENCDAQESSVNINSFIIENLGIVASTSLRAGIFTVDHPCFHVTVCFRDEL